MGGKISTAFPHRRAGERSNDNTPTSAELASKLFTTVLSLCFSALRSPITGVWRHNKYQRKGDFQDSFSDENSDDDTTNFEFEDTCDGSQASSQGRTATTAPSIISSNLGNNFVVSHLGWFTLDKCFDTHN